MNIVCLDGLDYRFVDEWDLQNLKQKVYGRHDVTLVEDKFTPLLFAGFLTGVPPSSFGYTKKFVVDRLHGGRVLNFPVMRRMKARGWLFKRSNMLKWQRDKTFIEVLRQKGKSVFVYEFPSFNEYVDNPIYRCDLWSFLKDSLDVRRGKIFEVWEKIRERMLLFSLAMEYVDVALFYSCLPDMAHHLFYRDDLRYVKEYYVKLDRWVGSLRSDVPMLVFSDHGNVVGEIEHSDFGFWSCSVEVPFSPFTILDFYDLVLEICN